MIVSRSVRGAQAGGTLLGIMTDIDPRQFSAAAERNREPILQALTRLLPPGGHALEIASGTGQHVVHLAAGLPGWTWQPSDPEPVARESIRGWTTSAQVANVRPPIALDVHAPAWPGVDEVDLVYCANMIHIAPWSACEALMAGTARHLRPGGLLVTYGPYQVEGEVTAPSNLAFDADLRARNPAWGLRWLHDVVNVARGHGLDFQQRLGLPANNLLLVFRRSA